MMNAVLLKRAMNYPDNASAFWVRMARASPRSSKLPLTIWFLWPAKLLKKKALPLATSPSKNSTF